jgi:hypothetical protein
MDNDAVGKDGNSLLWNTGFGSDGYKLGRS